MTELDYADQVVTSALVTTQAHPYKENIATRRTIVYQTLVDPTVVRIAAEKAKHKLFNKFLFRLNNPEEIEFVSIEKYYEPFVVVNGKYSIDYYRKSAYAVRVDREAREVILFDRTFIPEQAVGEHGIRLEGEERIIRETKAFLILNKDGQDSKVEDFPSALSEKNPEELVETFKMPGIPPEMDLHVIRKRISQRPNDVNRLVNEIFEVDERSLIYTPRFKVEYKCPRLGKEAYLEFDGVTSKLMGHDENFLSAAFSFVASQTKKLFYAVVNRIKPKDISQH